MQKDYNPASFCLVMIGLCFDRLFFVLAAALAVMAVLAADQYSRADFPADFVFDPKKVRVGSV